VAAAKNLDAVHINTSQTTARKIRVLGMRNSMSRERAESG